jgi:hypothetical protein
MIDTANVLDQIVSSKAVVIREVFPSRTSGAIWRCFWLSSLSVCVCVSVCLSVCERMCMW